MNVILVPWGASDRPLLDELLGDPAMMVHLGGPETEVQLDHRQARYAQPGSRQYKVLVGDEGAGWVGYWERGDAWELGWSVRPAFQGRGVAVAATRALIEIARREPEPRALHAYPSVDNAPSNAVCRRLGFTLLGAEDFEYPKGHHMRCNDWVLDP